MRFTRALIHIAIIIAITGTFTFVVSQRHLLAAPLTASSPTIDSVSPTYGYNSAPTTVMITGTNFYTTSTVWLNDILLTNATLINSGAFTATVPSNLPSGAYTVTVTNLGNQSAGLPYAFTVLMSGYTIARTWQNASTYLNTERGLHAAVAVNKHIYAFGGVSGGPLWSVLDSVERAKVNSDGSLSSWEFMTPMNGVHNIHAGIAVGNYIYSLGGSDLNLGCPGDRPSFYDVERVWVNPDGSLGAWQTLQPLIAPHCGGSAVFANGAIYILGGSNQSSVERAVVNSDGSLGQWQVVTPMTYKRLLVSAVAVGNYIYAVGGDDYQSANSVEYAAIKSDGTLGPWQLTTPPSRAFRQSAALAAEGYLYVFGGFNSVGGTENRVERALINSDSSLGPWQTVSLMNSGRVRLAVVQVDRSIFAVAGLSVGYVNSVERAPMNEETTNIINQYEYGLTINEGALFTNQTAVTLTIGAKIGTTLMQVSNDGGFAGAQWEPYILYKLWTISQYGNYVIPRVVYIRYKDANSNISSTFQDDIILDVNPPTGSVSVLKSTRANSISLPAQSFRIYLPLVTRNDPCVNCTLVQLLLSATDDVSGVGGMIISNNPIFSNAQWEPYTPQKTWLVSAIGTTTIYVRFRDNAGNVSPVYSTSYSP